MRKLAGLMELDASAVSLMLNGKRKMTAGEAGTAARLLGVPVDEVLRHAGVDVRGATAASVPIWGWVDAGGTVHEGRVLGPRTVSGPPGASEGMRALRAQTGGQFDGWLLFYRDAEGISLEAVGRLCVVKVAGQTGHRVGWVQRGYEAGWWNLASIRPGDPPEMVRLTSAVPIQWTRQ